MNIYLKLICGIFLLEILINLLGGQIYENGKFNINNFFITIIIFMLLGELVCKKKK